MRLDELEIGKDAVVAQVSSDDAALHQHILDMGLTPGTEVTMVKYAPMGDPLELRLRGYELTLRRADAARIEVRGVHDADGWRSSYGGTIYLTNGSHGCVNTPEAAAKTIYETVSIGTAVVVYNLDDPATEIVS